MGYQGLPIVPGLVEYDYSDVPPEPQTVNAGDTLTWTRAFDKYPASAGWILAYVLNSPTSRIVINSADIVAVGNAWTVTVPSSETQAWTPGTYDWLAVVQLAAAGSTPAQRFTVALGQVIVGIDILDATAPQDTRTPYQIALANIEAMLAGNAISGVQEYTIDGRMLRRYSISELLTLRGLYVSLVRQEKADRGEYQRPRTVAVHFGGFDA